MAEENMANIPPSVCESEIVKIERHQARIEFLEATNRDLLDHNKELLEQRRAVEQEVKDGHEREAELFSALAKSKGSPEVEAGLRILRQADDILEYYETGNRKARAFDWLVARLEQDLSIDLWRDKEECKVHILRLSFAGPTLLETIENALSERI